MVFASWNTYVGHRFVYQILLMPCFMYHILTYTHLKHLRSRLIISFGIFDQQIYVFSHSANTPVVAHLKANTVIGHFLNKVLQIN